MNSTTPHLHALLYVTCADSNEATHIARELLKDRLIACANIVPAITSLYEWQGTLESSTEVLLLLKTRSALSDEVTTRVQQLHSYTCPCITRLAIEGGLPLFLDWINTQTS